jgi:alpha-glucosidase (family GH31 glycosyl hydrolase)
VRAGAIVAFGPVKQYTDEPVDGPLTLVIYPGDDGSAMVYEDDGKTFDHRRGAFTKIALTWQDAERELTIAYASGSKQRPHTARKIEARIAGQKQTRRLVFKGKPLRVKL